MGPVLNLLSGAVARAAVSTCGRPWLDKDRKRETGTGKDISISANGLPPLTAESGDLLLTSNLQINKLVCVPGPLSPWHIRDLQNEAQSGIKSPNGK